MGLLRQLCLVFAFLSAGVTDSFIMATGGSTGAGDGALAAAAASQDNGNAASDGQQQGEIPLLPEPDPNSNLPSIKLAEPISFEEMGPVIINSDGKYCTDDCLFVLILTLHDGFPCHPSTIFNHAKKCICPFLFRTQRITPAHTPRL